MKRKIKDYETFYTHLYGEGYESIRNILPICEDKVSEEIIVTIDGKSLIKYTITKADFYRIRRFLIRQKGWEFEERNFN